MTNQQPYGQQPGWPAQPPGQQPYQPPPGPPPGPPRGGRPWVARHKVLTAIGGLAAIIVVSVAASGGSHPAPAAAPAAATSAPTDTAATAAAVAAPAKASKPAAAPKITYVVTGTAGAAQVTYGPSGSTFTGKVPMRVTKRLGSAAYYAIQAQLQGSGEVTVKIEINGKVISSGTADGGYNIATAEISQDPITGKWQDTQA